MKPFTVHKTGVPLTDSHDGRQVPGLKSDGQGSVPVS